MFCTIIKKMKKSKQNENLVSKQDVCVLMSFATMRGGRSLMLSYALMIHVY